MYKNYIFDLYGTLIDIRTDEYSEEFWDSYAKWLTENNMPYQGDEVHDIYKKEVKRLLLEPSNYVNPEIDIIPVFETICKKYRPDISNDDIWNAAVSFRIISTKFIKLYPNTMKVMNALKKSGKKIYLLSNAQRSFTWQELVKTGLEGMFDDIFISSDCGCKKPDPSFYHMLIDKHKLNIDECIMIGNDGSSDIAGAKAVGMDAFYVRTEISPENEPTPDCKYVFLDGDIGHVLELIR